eukprot:288768_1
MGQTGSKIKAYSSTFSLRSNLSMRDLLNSSSMSLWGDIDHPKRRKTPWYKNKTTRVAILVAVAVFAFVAIFVASLELHLAAPVLLMTSHDYTNVVAFNANTGQIITTALLDLSYPQKRLDLPKYVKENKIQFRSIITRNYNQITVVNGHHSIPFIATFDCTPRPGWRLHSYFANNSKYLAHPYGLTWYETRQWWLFTTQDTQSLFIFTEDGKPVSLPGMMQHFPGAVFTLINGTNGLHMDTYLPNIVPFINETKKERHADLKKKSQIMGLRGVAVDAQYNLIFVAAEILGKVLVFDIDANFTNVYNISLGLNDKFSPISVVNGAPYHPYTLFITERKHNNGIFAVRYSKTNYEMWWQAEKAPQLQHATGIALSPDSLFVLSQDTHTILRYSPYSGHYIGLVSHFVNNNPPAIITHKGIGKVRNPVESVRTLGEQLLYIPSGKRCTVS